MKTIILIFGIFVLGLFSAILNPVHAATTKIVPYQGKLTNVDGTNVADGSYNFKILFYDAVGSGTPPTGGSCVYAISGTCGTPTAYAVTVTNGIFYISIGDTGTNSLSAVNVNQDLWMQVTIGSETLAPRKRIGGAAFTSWNSLTDPTANLDLAMGSNTTTLTYGATTGSSTNLFNVTDTASNTGTGYVGTFATAASSAAKPFSINARGNIIFDTTATGGLTLGNTTAAQDVQFFSSSNKITSAGNLTLLGSVTTGSSGQFGITNAGNVSTSGTITSSANGAASTSALLLTGTPSTAGTTTTDFPLINVDNGTDPTDWSTNGTYLGLNGTSGFTGNFLDFHVNGGSSLFKVRSNGGVDIISPIGQNDAPFIARNTGVGDAGYAVSNWLGYAQDGTTETSRVSVGGGFYGASFNSIDATVGISMISNSRLHINAPSVWLGTAGADILFKSPNGSLTKSVYLANDGTFNISIGTNADSWTTNNVLFATKTPGGGNRTTFGNFGNLDINMTNPNGGTGWDSTNLFSANIDPATTYTGNLAQWSVSSVIKAKIDASGNLTVASCTGCGGGGATWSALSSPTGNQALTMGAYTSTWTYGATTGASTNLFNITDTASNTGTGYLVNFGTAALSAAKPLSVSARGNIIFDTTATGGLTLGNTTAAQDVQFFSSSNKITSAGALTVASNINSTSGVYQIGGSTILHNYGTNNTFVGIGAGNISLTGHTNVAVGTNAGLVLTSGNNNSFFGMNAGTTNTTGSDNTFIGDAAGFSNIDGASNVFIGLSAGEDNISGTENTYVGRSAGANATGVSNAYFGRSAGLDNTTGGFNTFLGNAAGDNVTTGSKNIIIGYQSKVTNGSGSISSSIGIGYNTTITASNQLVIGSDDTNGTITDSFWGSGVANSTVSNFAFNATGASGTNTAGPSLLFNGGRGTGTGVGGDLIFQTALAGTTGFTQNALTERLRIASTGLITISSTGAINRSGLLLTGTPSTAGDTTTDFPLINVDNGTDPTDWSTNGTYLGLNGTSGFTGNFLDFHVNGGVSVAKLDSAGALTVASCSGCSSTWNSLTAPTGNLAMNMYQSVGTSFTTTFTYGNATGASTNLFNITDTASNTGTGSLLNISTAASSAAKPFSIGARGNTIFDTTATGGLTLGNSTAAQDVNFFSTSNKISSAGNLTLLGSVTTGSSGQFGITNAGNVSTSGTITSSANGAVNTTALLLTGTPSTAGDTTTDFPLINVDNGTDPTTWNTNGTYLGLNGTSGFTGNFLDFHVNGGVSVAKIDYTGLITTTGGITSPGAGSSSERFGASATAAGNFGIALGNTATASGSSSVAIGYTSTASATHAVAIGEQANASGNDSFALGYLAAATHNSVAIGRSASAGFNPSIAIGHLSAATAANQLVIGATDASGNGKITDAYIGSGVTGWSGVIPSNIALNATGGNGTSIAGASFLLNGGISTGTATGGDLIFQTSPAGGVSNTTPNSLVERLRIASTGLVTLASTGAINRSALLLTGTPSTAGDTTTDFPLINVDNGTDPTTWNTNGTYLGLNGTSGFTGNFLDFHVNGGVSVAKLDSAGALTVASCSGCSSTWNSLTAPTGNLAMNMYQSVGTSFTTTFTYGNATGASTNLFNITDTASNTGTGSLLNISTAASSAAKPFSIGARGNTIIDTTAAGGLTIGNATAAQSITIDSGTATLSFGNSANAKIINIGSNTGASTTIINAGVNATSGNQGVVIGSSTTDTNQVNFQLDSYSTYADTASTCTTTLNQGAIYYNTASNSIRTCLNGAWEDVVSTASLGLQLFGVVPDSGGNTAVGDIAGVVSATNGPCKVTWTSSTTVSVSACVAFSGGRKVIVAAATLPAVTTTNGNFQHVCLTGTSGAPALSTSGAETANLGTVSLNSASVGSPILCLADIKTSASAITNIYDTRTFTTTTKEYITLQTTAPILGSLVVNSATGGVGLVTASSATVVGNLRGVVVATTGAASANTMNAIIAIVGQAWVKTTVSIAFSASNTIQSSANGVGYAQAAAASTTFNANLGQMRNATTAICTTLGTNACQQSLLTTIDIK